MHTSLPTKRAQKVIDRCRRLATFTETPGSLRRTFLSAPMQECHEEIIRWLRPLDTQVRIDAAGNLRAVYPAGNPSSPRLLIGSHLDTVVNAGAYDGILGVVLAITLLEELHGRKLPFAIEVVGFSEEEGVRFGIPFIGSRALVGRLDKKLLSSLDTQGISLRKAIDAFQLNPDDIPQAALGDDALAYLEFHIEQGPVLEQLNQPLAAVEAIAGQSRLEFKFIGRANHAGTTPMHLRQDALAGAAEWVGIVERMAQSVSGLVATVGKLEAKPGAVNVIASEVTCSLDVRHELDDIRLRAVQDLIREAQEIASRHGLSVRTDTLLDQRAVAMDPFLTSEIGKAIVEAGCKSHRMISGAGHDAMILAEKVPAAMIFLRTPGGISHDPAETVMVEDVEKTIACGLHLLDRLAASPEFLTRTTRA